LLSFLPTTSFAQVDAVAHAVKAEQFKKVKNYRAAILEYDKAHKAAPDKHEFLVEKSKCFFLLKDLDNAANALEKAVLVKNDETELLVSLAKIYGQLGNANKTIEYLQKAYRLDKDDSHKKKYKEQIIKILQNKKLHHEADKHFAEYLEKFPQDEQFWLLAAQNANVANLHTKAVNYATYPLDKQKDPLNAAKFHYEIAVASYKTENYAKLREHVEKASFGAYKPLVFRFTAEYQCTIAMVFLKISDYETAKIHLQKAQKIQEKCHKISEVMSLIAELQSDKSALIETHQKAALTESSAHRRTEHLLKVAQLCLENRRDKEALQAADEVIKIAPLNFHAYFLKAVSLKNLKKEQDALLQLKQIVDLPELSAEQKSLYALLIALIHRGIGEKDASEAFFSRVSAAPYRFVASEISERVKNAGTH
jgi:tetratricopeptide (TPR) repeat protein